MNKKLIAAAVAAGLAAPMAAQADATAYAQVQFEIANIDNGTNSNTYVTDQQRGRIGVKGDHDLGNGMKSFAMAEFDFEGGNRDAEFGNVSGPVAVTTGGGSATLTQRHALRVREINAGIKGSFGTVMIGTMKSAYKYTGGVKYDPFVTTTLEARGNGGMTGTIWGQNGFLSNAVAYKNKFGAVGLWITYSPDDTDRNNDGQSDAGEYSAALKFSGGSFEAFVAAVDNGYSDAGGGTYDSTKVGGQWKAGPHKISAQYEMSSRNNVDTDTYFVGYQMKMGKNSLVAQLGNNDPDGPNNDEDYYALGVIHKFNKQTRVFAGYRSTSPAVGNDETSLSVGFRVDI
jgi:predicted porin